jgi:nucleoside-diphosphate-sugar epimerase
MNRRSAMRMISEAVPTGKSDLSKQEYKTLLGLTAALLDASPDAVLEYERFLAVQRRGILSSRSQLSSWLRGKRVLVTGGTGCVGSALLRLLCELPTESLHSASRGLTATRHYVSRATYHHVDVRSQADLTSLLAHVRPDVVFHVAGQRDPGLAEREVWQTVTTNVLGTRNVITACRDARVSQVVSASTGKALRPYSPDVYTASKRVAECLHAEAATVTQMSLSAARFTHVVDNSIVHARLLNWIKLGEPVRVHATDVSFYVQSALESAQLLLVAGLGARPSKFTVNAINDLGLPVSLVDVALGALQRLGLRSPIYVSGYTAGYEERAFPGLYHPREAGDLSPMISAFESFLVECGVCPEVDSFPLTICTSESSRAYLGHLDSLCAKTSDPLALKQALDDLSWSCYRDAVDAVPPTRRAQLVKLCLPYERELPPEHQLMLSYLRA